MSEVGDGDVFVVFAWTDRRCERRQRTRGEVVATLSDVVLTTVALYLLMEEQMYEAVVLVVGQGREECCVAGGVWVGRRRGEEASQHFCGACAVLVGLNAIVPCPRRVLLDVLWAVEERRGRRAGRLDRIVIATVGSVWLTGG